MNPNEMANWMNNIIGKGQRFSWSYFYEKGSGHTVIVFKKNGKLRMYDPQTNTMSKGRDFLEELEEH